MRPPRKPKDGFHPDIERLLDDDRRREIRVEVTGVLCDLGTVLDLSHGGMGVLISGPCTEGSEVELDVFTPADDGPEETVRIPVKAVCRWSRSCDAGTIAGFRFFRLTDAQRGLIDAVIELRRSAPPEA